MLKFGNTPFPTRDMCQKSPTQYQDQGTSFSNSLTASVTGGCAKLDSLSKTSRLSEWKQEMDCLDEAE